MIRTFNRQPMSVNTPDKDSIKNYFTTQFEWKGLNDDKNFAAVDQNTYQDCNNVYVDSEGLLRSRPAIKHTNDPHINIVDYYVYPNCVVYKIMSPVDSHCSLVFVQGTNQHTYLLKAGDTYFQDVTLVNADNKIFVFSAYALYVYDTETMTGRDGTNDIYIPETEIYGDGVKTKDGESPNLLTDSYYKTYVYTGIGEPNYALFIGKDIKVVLDDTTYDVSNFKKDQELTFLSKVAGISEDSIESGTNLSPVGTLLKPHAYVSISSLGSMVVSNYINLSTTNTPNLQWSIYYSPDGKTYDKLPYLADILGEPIIAEDGAYVFCFTKTGLQVISVLKNYYDEITDSTIYKYGSWTLLDSLSDINNLPTSNPSQFNQNVFVNGCFINDENYAFIYGTTIAANDGGYYPKYSSLKVYIRYNNVVSVKTYSPDIIGQVLIVGKYRPYIVCKLFENRFDIICAYTAELAIGALRLQCLYLSSTDSFAITAKVNTFVTYPDNIAIYLGDNYSSVFWIDKVNDVLKLSTVLYKSDGTSVVLLEMLEGFEAVQFGVDIPYLYTNKGLYALTGENDIASFITDADYRENMLLPFTIDNTVPLKFYNNVSYYLHGNDILSTTNIVTIKELVPGTYNYKLFDYVSKLDNYFVALGNKTYINRLTSDEFKWYLPMNTENKYESEVTNLHPISSTEMAIFLKDAIYYTVWDNNLLTYRYYKSKIQVGCKPGCDVLTTFDGKYVIFTSARGLVAMNYQDFVATTDQTILYISDSIYQVFYNYITDKQSANEVKLYKFGYWLIVYKQDSLKGFIYDLRNASWWPVASFKNIVKIVTENDKPKLLINSALYMFDVNDVKYYDFDGNKKYDIVWHLLSQKLYLQALNYYKHIVNITFDSVHDVTLLEEDDYNINELDFKLQVNNYRKKVNGNIDSDDYVSVNYNVNIARTFVQRLNYGKVNEFQYKLSSDTEAAIKVPLSLASISVKYKVGGQVR